MERKELQILLTLKDEASKALSEVGGRLEQMQPALKNVAKVSGAAFGTMSAGILKADSDFATINLHIQRAGANVGATTETLDKMFKTAIDASRGTAASAEDAARALSFLAGGSVNAEEAMESLADTVKFATANQLSLENAALVTSQAMTLFGIEAEDVTRVLDVLTKSGQISYSTTEELATAFGEVAPIASQLGISIEDLTAIIGTMGDANILGSQAGVALKRAFTELLNPTKQQTEAFEKMGIKVSDMTALLNDPIEMLRKIEVALADVEDPIVRASILSQMFGAISGPALSALLGLGTEAIEEQKEMLLASAGALEESSRRVDSARSVWSQLRDSFNEISGTLGNAMSPEMEKLRDTIAELTTKIIGWINENPKLVSNLAIILTTITGLVAGLSTAGIVIGQVVKGFTLLAPVLKAAGAAVAALSAPVWAIIGLLTAIAGVIVWWANNWEENVETIKWVWGMFTEFLKNTWTTVRDFFVSTWEAIRQTFTTVTTAIATSVQSWFVEKPVNAIKSAWEGIRSFFSGLWESIVGTFQGAIERITDIVDRIVRAAQRARDAARDVASAAGSRVRDAVSSVGSTLGRVFSVNDAIISPKGDIITTHPDDYLIATKNPYALANAGGAINITITGNTFMGREGIAEEIGDAIIARLQRSRRL